MTSLLVFSGYLGSIVVSDFLKDNKAIKSIEIPKPINVLATADLKLKSNNKMGRCFDKKYMSKTQLNATKGGGIFSSSFKLLRLSDSW